MRKAGLELEDISLIKAHATGTKTGDLAEARVLSEIWGNVSNKPTVIAPKAEIGHCISASGPIELIMALSCLKQGVAPGLSHDYELDPMLTLPFAAKNRAINGSIGLCNSFGFGGKNQALIIKNA
jgi:3-oxoacyl-[acyl-carrier-protein] synthase II/beta-ketoacyl ACP synthase